MFRCLSRAGMVSRKVDIRSETGTGVEPPNAGLNQLSAEFWTLLMHLYGI